MRRTVAGFAERARSPRITWVPRVAGRVCTPPTDERPAGPTDAAESVDPTATPDLAAGTGRPHETETETGATEPADRARGPAGLLDPDAFWTGCKSGLVATVVMTAYRLPVARSLPPTARFWAQYVGGGDPAEYPVEGLVLHLVYGTAAGGVFGLLFAGRTDGSEARDEWKGILGATAYGLALSVFGVRVVLARVLGMTDLEPDERLVFHVSHVVYALTLGTMVGSRLED